MATISFKIGDETKSELDSLVERFGLNASEIFRQALEAKIQEIRQDAIGVSLTKKERLFLHNQYQILSSLAEDEHEKKEYAQNCKMLTDGYSMQYDSLFDYFDDDVPRELSKEVLEILEIHRAMFTFFMEQGKGVLDPADFEFRGFDANEESTHFAFVRYFIVDLDRYRELRYEENPSFNTHAPMLSRYRDMIEYWGKIGKPHNLNRKHIDALLRLKFPWKFTTP